MHAREKASVPNTKVFHPAKIAGPSACVQQVPRLGNDQGVVQFETLAIAYKEDANRSAMGIRKVGMRCGTRAVGLKNHLLPGPTGLLVYLFTLGIWLVCRVVESRSGIRA